MLDTSDDPGQSPLKAMESAHVCDDRHSFRETVERRWYGDHL